MKTTSSQQKVTTLRCFTWIASGCLICVISLHGADTWVWQRETNAPPIAGRYGHAIVWTGTELIIWGGSVLINQTSVPANDGACYNPATHAWRLMSNQNAPSPRVNFSVVWTGEEMLIWGGAYFGDGARYNPRTNTWRPMRLAGAPAARAYHSAVWSGSEMFIWGGIGHNDGARYNPATDSWVLFTGRNGFMPDERTDHRAVWTGTRMLISSGERWDFSGSHIAIQMRDDLWSYDPLTNQWSLLSTSGNRRSRHALVWTGNQLLSWGGYGGDGVGYVNTGARYDPSGGSWTPITTNGAPAARAWPSYVWTGEEMIVTGGDLSDYRTNTTASGGRYRPATDTWTPLTTNGAPRFIDVGPGFGSVAVWTGKAMLVYAGAETGGCAVFAYRPPSIYAGDAIPDDWQVRYFGEDNPQGLPQADPDGDGQNNWMEYLAGTDPTRADSKFSLRLKWTNSIPRLEFAPVVTNRTYVVEATDNVGSQGFQVVTGSTAVDVGGTRTVTLLEETHPSRFYRVRIGL